MALNIHKVALVGTGTLGTQIALQAAYSGYQVSAFDQDPGSLDRHLANSLKLSEKSGQKVFNVAAWPEAAKKISFFTEMAPALKEADLVIEAVPENLPLKLKVWAEMDRLAPQGAVLATNSSSLPVSKLEGATGRPELCLNLHFYYFPLGQKMADVMGGAKTRPEVVEAGRNFVASLGCLPLAVKKELLGFCFNRVWRAIKRETLHMWAGGYVDFRDVDRGFMVFTGTPWGPFGLMDAVGLDVIYDIEMVYYNDSQDPKDHPPQELLDMVRRGELGVKTNKGFYTYPDPEYTRPDFLTPKIKKD